MTRAAKPSANRRGRPRLCGNLGIPVFLRAVDQAQKARWADAAERAQQTLNEWIRTALDERAAHWE